MSEPQTQLHESPRVPWTLINEDERLVAAKPQDLPHEEQGRLCDAKAIEEEATDEEANEIKQKS